MLNFAIREESCVAAVGAQLRDKRYGHSAIGVVLSGSFEYRAGNGCATAVPGTLILGNAAESFRCVHSERGGNRRQVARFDHRFVEDIARDVGLSEPTFRRGVVPPGNLAASAFGFMQRLALADGDREEAAYELAGLALQLDRSALMPDRVSPRNRRRVLAVVVHLESHFNQPWSLHALANLAQLSSYHFLRVFKSVVGQSPAQYILHARLRAAATHLLSSRAPVSQVALQAGFNDISHFNACFRRQFGTSPMRWRA